MKAFLGLWIVQAVQLDPCQPCVSVEQNRGSGQLVTRTWVQDIFQGTLTNETRCLVCETVRSKDEEFLDLSVDIEQNTSLTHCLR